MAIRMQVVVVDEQGMLSIYSSPGKQYEYSALTGIMGVP